VWLAIALGLIAAGGGGLVLLQRRGGAVPAALGIAESPSTGGGTTRDLATMPTDTTGPVPAAGGPAASEGPGVGLSEDLGWDEALDGWTDEDDAR
jgi:hypothetical protein